MIPFFSKSKAIESYVHILPRVLKKAHGKKKQYSREQILEAIEQTSLNSKYCEYAFVIFMSKKSFESLQIESVGNYEQLRMEVAKKFFKGDDLFNIHDLFLLSKIHSQKGQIFDPTDISISAIGDPVQDFYDADGD